MEYTEAEFDEVMDDYEVCQHVRDYAWELLKQVNFLSSHVGEMMEAGDALVAAGNNVAADLINERRITARMRRAIYQNCGCLTKNIPSPTDEW